MRCFVLYCHSRGVATVHMSKTLAKQEQELLVAAGMEPVLLETTLDSGALVGLAAAMRSERQGKIREAVYAARK